MSAAVRGKAPVAVEVARVRETEAAEGVADTQVPAQLTQEPIGLGAAVDLDRVVAELVEAQRRIRTLEDIAAAQRQDFSKTKDLAQKNKLLEKDIRDAQNKCRSVLLDVLMKHNIQPEIALDPDDL